MHKKILAKFSKKKMLGFQGFKVLNQLQTQPSKVIRISFELIQYFFELKLD